MLEKKKTGPFRGNPVVNGVLWWWDLVFIAISAFGAVALNSGIHVVFMFLFFGLWFWAEFSRQVYNRKYDERYALRVEAIWAKEDSR